jgi:hypothetical protein
VIVLTYIYAESNGVSISSSLSFSRERLTGPLEGLNIDTKKVCAILILDDGPGSGMVVVEGFENSVNTGNNDGKYWIRILKPEQKCLVVGRCRFWLCSSTVSAWSGFSSTQTPNEADTSAGSISAWSQWEWDPFRSRWGRYRLSGGHYEYDWQNPAS